MILHLSQRFLTLARTFIRASALLELPPPARSFGRLPSRSWIPFRVLVPWSVTHPSGDPSPLEVVRRQLHEHLVARDHADEVHPHLPGDVRQDLVPVLELDLEHRVRKGLGNGPFHLNDVFVRQQRSRHGSPRKYPGAEAPERMARGNVQCSKAHHALRLPSPTR